jgi:hypothetical protein
LTGSGIISTFLSLNAAAASNGLTIIRLPNKPNSPPRFALLLSIDNSFARFAKFSPFLNLSNIAIASLCFFTSISEHLILSANYFFLSHFITNNQFLDKYCYLAPIVSRPFPFLGGVIIQWD